MLDDKDIDAVIIATPNHWHALATIWALQAGKHVYVEKPSSHTVWEGRQMVEAAARYGKIVQVGTMNRSRPAVRAAIKFIQDGGIGKVYMARGLCFKPRPNIGKYPDGPMAAGEKFAMTVGVDQLRTGLRRRVPVEGRLRPVARAGAEAAVQPQPLPLQLALALGLRQRRHRQPGPAPVRHRALGPRQAGAPGQDQLDGRLLRPRVGAGNARHADGALRVRRRHDPRVRRRAASTPTTKAASASATCSTARRAGCGSTRPAAAGSRTWARSARRTRRAPARGAAGRRAPSPIGLTTTEFPHYQNFVDAHSRQRSEAADVRHPRGAPVVDAAAPREHLVSRRPRAHSSTARPSGSSDDKKADALLTREYRKGFEIPKIAVVAPPAVAARRRTARHSAQCDTNLRFPEPSQLSRESGRRRQSLVRCLQSLPLDVLAIVRFQILDAIGRNRQP